MQETRSTIEQPISPEDINTSQKSSIQSLKNLQDGNYSIWYENTCIVENCAFKNSLTFRSIGLLKHKHLNDDEGLLLMPCNGIHTFFMRFPIDVILLDKECRITRVIENILPWKIVLPTFKTHATIELAGGSLARKGSLLKKKDRLYLDKKKSSKI